MVIVLNNRKEEFSGNKLSISQLLEEKKYTFRLRIIKVNGVLIHKDLYDTTFIADGDNVQMIYLMSGG